TAQPGSLSASDPDSDSLTYTIVRNPSYGSLSAFSSSTGAFTYQPAADYNGSDSFDFRVSDGLASSTTATVSITVNSINDPPVAEAGPDQTVNEGAVVSFDGRGSSDVDGGPLSY